MSRAAGRHRRTASRAFGPGSRRVIASSLGAVAAGALAGCGSSASTGTGRTSSAAATSTATSVVVAEPTTSAGRRRLRAQELAIHRQVLAALHSAAHRRGHYGGIPAVLRSAVTPVDRTVTADGRRPALSVEGLTVRLRLPAGQALATVVGPYVPHRLQGTGVRTAPVHFLVRLASVTGHIPVSPRLFTITDELGQTLRPTVRLASGRPVADGQFASRSVALTLSTTLPIGNGTLCYTPGGRHYLAAWDFDVETD